MKTCVECCKALKEPCSFSECRYHLEYEDDLNCTFIAIDKNGPMTLRQIAPRLGISFIRVRQIEEKTKEKLGKRIRNKGLLSILPDASTS